MTVWHMIVIIAKTAMVISYALLSMFYAYFTAAKLLESDSLKITWTYLFSFSIIWKRIIYFRGGLPKLEGFFYIL